MWAWSWWSYSYLIQNLLNSPNDLKKAATNNDNYYYVNRITYSSTVDSTQTRLILSQIPCSDDANSEFIRFSQRRLITWERDIVPAEGVTNILFHYTCAVLIVCLLTNNYATLELIHFSMKTWFCGMLRKNKNFEPVYQRLPSSK